MSWIIHINGLPAVGKRTIGEVVAIELGARFVDNHVLHDVAFACVGRGDPDRWPLYEVVRSASYAALGCRPASERLVLTNALCREAPREVDAWRHVVGLAISRGVPLIPIVLTAPITVLSERMRSPDRLSTKLRDPDRLAPMMQTYSLQIPDVAETLVLDVGTMSVPEAARSIVDHVETLDGITTVATTEHFRFRT